MMHITYTSRQGSYTWNELCCLSRALGFQADTLNKCIPEEIRTSNDRITHKEILKLIDLKYFNDVVDRTFNMHTADYNINVLKKSLKLLDHHLLSFSQLYDVRIAFQVYEASDMRGMMTDQHTLMRTLKLCNRTVAPLKLMHRVKHLQELFDEPDRIQFYEFLDLLLLCDLIPDVVVASQKNATLNKTEHELYELVDIKKVCTTLDEKIENHLNSMFMRTERDYGKEHHGDKRIPREPAVDTSERKKRVRHHGVRYKELQNHIDHSTRRVLRTKAGHIRERPVSAPSVEPSECEARVVQERPHTVDQIVRNNFSRAGVCLRLRPFSAPVMTCQKTQGLPSKKKTPSTMNQHLDPKATLFKKYLEDYQSRKDAAVFTEPHASIDLDIEDHGIPYTLKHSPSKCKIKTPQLVSRKSLEDRQDILNNLQYEIETLEERTIKQLYTGLNQIYPTYKERRLLEKSKSKPKEETKKVKKKSKKVNRESFERLSRPEPRQFLAVHDGNCDARLMVSGLKQLRSKHQKGHQVSVMDGQTSICSLENLPKTSRRDAGSISSVDEASAKTFDTSRHSWLTNNIRISHAHMQDHEKYKHMRVGTAAVLYDHFHCDNTAESSHIQKVKDSNENEINCTNDDDDVETFSKKSDSRPPSINTLHKLLNIDQSVGSMYQSVDPRSAQREKAFITRRLHSYDDDELKINGVLLSEIDKLTIKQDLEKIPSVKKRSLPALAAVN